MKKPETFRHGILAVHHTVVWSLRECMGELVDGKRVGGKSLGKRTPSAERIARQKAKKASAG